jgi:hypothetical protein
MNRLPIASKHIDALKDWIATYKNAIVTTDQIRSIAIICGLPKNSTFISTFTKAPFIKKVARGKYKFVSDVTEGALDNTIKEYGCILKKYESNKARKLSIPKQEILVAPTMQQKALEQFAIDFLNTLGYRIYKKC